MSHGDTGQQSSLQQESSLWCETEKYESLRVAYIIIPSIGVVDLYIGLGNDLEGVS